MTTSVRAEGRTTVLSFRSAISNLPRILWWWQEYGPHAEKLQEAPAPLADDPSRKRLKTIHLFGQGDVKLSHSPSTMRRQRHLHAVVNIRPFGVMIELLRDECSPCHEGEGLIEALELEAFAD